MNFDQQSPFSVHEIAASCGKVHRGGEKLWSRFRVEWFRYKDGLVEGIYCRLI